MTVASRWVAGLGEMRTLGGHVTQLQVCSPRAERRHVSHYHSALSADILPTPHFIGSLRNDRTNLMSPLCDCIGIDLISFKTCFGPSSHVTPHKPHWFFHVLCRTTPCAAGANLVGMIVRCKPQPRAPSIPQPTPLLCTNARPATQVNPPLVLENALPLQCLLQVGLAPRPAAKQSGLAKLQSLLSNKDKDKEVCSRWPDANSTFPSTCVLSASAKYRLASLNDLPDALRRSPGPLFGCTWAIRKNDLDLSSPTEGHGPTWSERPRPNTGGCPNDSRWVLTQTHTELTARALLCHQECAPACLVFCCLLRAAHCLSSALRHLPRKSRVDSSNPSTRPLLLGTDSSTYREVLMVRFARHESAPACLVFLMLLDVVRVAWPRCSLSLRGPSLQGVTTRKAPQKGRWLRSDKEHTRRARSEVITTHFVGQMASQCRNHSPHF